MKPAQWLEACRNRLNIRSNYGLSKRWHISEAALSRYESGERMPDMRTRILIADTLEIPLEQVAKDPDLERPRKPAKKRLTVASGLFSILVAVDAILFPALGAWTGNTAWAGTLHQQPNENEKPLQPIHYAFFSWIKRLARSFQLTGANPAPVS